jgi:hypothetical protein
LIEPTSFELKDFGEDSKTNYEILQKLLSKKLVNHSFTEDGVKAKNEKVAAMLLDSGRQFTNIIQIWMESIKLDEKKSGKSDK